MEEIMLKLNEFSHNHHPSRVKMLAKYIRRGISVYKNHLDTYTDRFCIYIVGRHGWTPPVFFHHLECGCKKNENPDCRRRT